MAVMVMVNMATASMVMAAMGTGSMAMENPGTEDTEKKRSIKLSRSRTRKTRRKLKVPETCQRFRIVLEYTKV